MKSCNSVEGDGRFTPKDNPQLKSAILEARKLNKSDIKEVADLLKMPSKKLH